MMSPMHNCKSIIINFRFLPMFWSLIHIHGIWILLLHKLGNIIMIFFFFLITSIRIEWICSHIHNLLLTLSPTLSLFPVLIHVFDVVKVSGKTFFVRLNDSLPNNNCRFVLNYHTKLILHCIK